MNQNPNRREFLKTAGLTTFGLNVLPLLTTRRAPSDKVRIAHIGLGGMGNNHMKWFANLPDAEIVALCDVDELHLGETKKRLEEMKPGIKVDTYGDFRRILDRKDIDAITIATPDHWHAQIATLAFQAGKDVYGEKPLSYCQREGKMMLKNLERYDRIFQMGNQIHAGDNFHRVVELIQSGAIGNVHTVRLWKQSNTKELGSPAVQPVPRTLNWDMWLGPAPFTEYIPEKCHFTYRYFLDYSGGEFADFWCHIADVMYSALHPKGLKKINARGTAYEGIADAPRTLDVDYEFDGLKVYWSSTPPNITGAADRGIGAFFEGDKGTLMCDYNTRVLNINGETMTDIASVPITNPRSPGHQQNFLDCVKSRRQPESNLAYARELTIPMHLGLISYRLKRELTWNAGKEKFVDDKEANRLLSRKPRKGWDLA